MSWRDDPRFRRLEDLFFERFFYNDLISSEDDPQLDAANLMAMLAFPGMLTLYWVPKYYITLAQAPESVRAVEAFGDRFWWIAFQMGLLALVTTLQWERLYPDRRDYSILGPQPVSIGTLFKAQVFALLRFVGLFFLLINGFAALFFPLAAVPYKAGMEEGLLFTATHWMSLIASGAAVVAFIGGLQGLLIVALPTRLFVRMSAVVQSLLAALLILFVVAIPIWRGRVMSGGSTLEEITATSDWIWILPPAWFAGLGEWAAGRNVDLFQPLALTALSALAITTVVFVGTYLATYQRFTARSLEGPVIRRNSRAPLAAVLRRILRWRWLRDRLQEATFFFTLRTLIRSGPHRLRVGGFLAIGLGVALSQLWTASNRGDIAEVALAQPYVLLFLALAGLRIAFKIPADLTANWVFRFHLRPDPARYQRGVRKAIWMAAPLPLGILSTIGVLALFPTEVAAYRLPVWLVACWVSTEAVLWQLPKIPFTCRYLAGGAHAIILWTFCAVGMLLYSLFLSSAEQQVFENPWKAGGLLLLLPILVRYLRSPATEIQFEDSDPWIEPLRLS